MKGYKAFNTDLTCKGYKYELDKIHVLDGEPVLCKSGFHFCTELEDVLKYYLEPNMRVFEIEANGAITEVIEDCSKRACSEITLIRELSLDEVAQSITESEFAYQWARDIGNQDIMINRITDPEYVYYWAKYIGNQDAMINRITDSEYAYYWARYIGNRDVMIDRVTESKWAYLWAMYIGDKDIMIDRINESRWAYKWAKYIGNRDIIIDKIKGEYHISIWLMKWPEDKQYFIDKGLIA